jgi:hypothetical protein
VIHWFAATNERVPFAMEHGNDRFYFVRCVSPQNNREARRKDKFFQEWVPKFKDPMLLDMFYAAAKKLCSQMSEARCLEMTSRARRQTIWEYLKTASMRPWEQFVANRLAELYDQEPVDGEDHPPVFVAKDLVDLTRREYRNIGENDIYARLNEMGYTRLRRPDGSHVQRRMKSGGRVVLWAKRADADAFAQVTNYGAVIIRSLFVNSGNLE